MIIETFIRRLLKEYGGTLVKRTEVPDSIRQWVEPILGKITKYEINQTGKIRMGIPWHEADREYYQIFKLEGEEYKRVGDPINVAGWDMVVASSKTMDIPSGFVVVRAGTYPKRVEIYTAPDAMKFLSTASPDELEPTEVYALVVAKGLKPFARPKFDDSVYEKLIQKGFMAKNKSITMNGRNYLTALGRDTVNNIIKSVPEKITGRYPQTYL